MKKGLFFVVSFFIAIGCYSQSHWQWNAGLENHFQLSKKETKNLESAGSIGNMPRVAFSASQGVAINLGFSRYSDSSNLTWSINVQQLWGNSMSSGSQRDTLQNQEELIQSRQTNLKMGIGYQNNGKHKYSFAFGPLLPLGGKHKSTLFFEDATEKFSAEYETTFSSSIGVWAAADYQFQVNEKAFVFGGIGLQLQNRNISSRSLEEFKSLKGTTTENSYAPDTYHKEYVFIEKIEAGMNDEIINPSGVDLNQARELQTQQYSFSSIYIQFGVKYSLF